MAISRSDMERQLRKDGGILTLDDARKMAPPGEDLAYINKDEAALLKSLGGAGEDINGTGIKSYFLKKVFRKAKKAVKKIVKSPIGKIGLGAALLGGLGGAGSIGKFFGKGSFNPFMAKGKFSGLGSLLNKAGLVSGTGGLTGLGKIAGITGLSGLGGLLAAKEQDEDDEIDINDRGEGIDFADIIARAKKGDPEFRFLPPSQFQNLAEGGEVNKTISIIQDMLNRGIDDSTISSITGASQEEINIIKTKQRQNKAEGGIMNLGGNEMDLRGGGFVPIGAKEKADDVPARLSKNEFVMTADAVRAAGGGSVDKGADKMYKMMKNLEAQV